MFPFFIVRYCLLFLILFLPFQVFSKDLAITPMPAISIHFSEHPITLDTPVIKYQDTTYIPLRSTLRYFPATLSFRRKQEVYVFTLPSGKTVSIAPYSRVFYVGRTKKTFTHKPIIYLTRLYVPLAQFLSTIGYTYESKQNALYIINSTPTPPPPPSYGDTLFSYTYSPTKDLNLPRFSLKKPLSLHVKGKTFSLTNRFFYDKKGHMYVDFSSIFSHLGYKVYSNATQLTLTRSGITYRFSPNSRLVQLERHGIQTTKTLPLPTRYTSSRYYIPLYYFSQSLGYHLTWDKRYRLIRFLTIISSVKFFKDGDNFTLVLHSSNPLLASKKTSLLNPRRYYWDIRQASFPRDQIYKSLSNSPFLTFSAANHPNRSRLVFSVSTPLSTQKTVYSDRLEIRFSPKTFKKRTPPSKPRQSPPIKPVATLKKRAPTPVIPKGKPLRGRVIAIDPGHGGFDPGSIGLKNDYEKYYTLDISKRLRKKLLLHGARVLMARTSDTNPSLYARTHLANRHNADILISIHINSFVKPYAYGTETFYYKKKDKSLSLYVHKEMVKTLNLYDKGLKKAHMYVLYHSKMPGTLVEPCFITNPREHKLLQTEVFRQKIADALFRGIYTYFSQSH